MSYTSDDNYKFGEILKKLRQENGLSQVEVADRMNVTPGYISNVEKGRTAMSLRMLVYFARIFDCSLDSIVGMMDATYEQESIDREIMREISKLDSVSKKKLLKTLKIWND
ncbi:MAG: helix-turn-helix transcriptional regulator [Eubacterium sp.]|nr:helix-turn-helix transcriptional regulator [Eubacterium sp.]